MVLEAKGKVYSSNMWHISCCNTKQTSSYWNYIDIVINRCEVDSNFMNLGDGLGAK